MFTKFGFTVQVHNDLTAEAILSELKRLGQRSFANEDALVRDRLFKKRVILVGSDDMKRTYIFDNICFACPKFSFGVT